MSLFTVDNFAAKLCGIVLSDNREVQVKEWRLLGQEKDGTLLFSWVQFSKTVEERTHIGLYSYNENKLDVIYAFNKRTNVIQASINLNRTTLGFVVKEISNAKIEGEVNNVYRAFLVSLDQEQKKLHDLNLERSKQIMLQFIYNKQSILNENQPDKFLVFIHRESILQYKIEQNDEVFCVESLVRKFFWAQWDPVHQTLYYIHYRKPIHHTLGEEDDIKKDLEAKLSPTLSGLQFHNDLPHETVMNIPLNLPHLPTLLGSCGIYEDDTVPLRIHDCSLDLTVVTDLDNIVCICHHYLYQPIQPAPNLEDNDETLVHFAYSVTVLHQSCVIHCVVPGIPWNQAKTIRPTFILHGELLDHHILVFIPGICTQLLDIGINHEPVCHITTTTKIHDLKPQNINLAPIFNAKSSQVINLVNLDLVEISLSNNQLIETFKSNTVIENKLSILHYFLIHHFDIDIAIELITHQIEKCQLLGLPQILKEFLVGSAYVTAERSLPLDARELVNLLPVTTQPTGFDVEVKIFDKTISLSQDVLWNASMMLLSPQQRLVPYRVDIWTKLWDRIVKLTKGKQKFRPNHVVEKLLVSLVCYQPEALSRSSTPLSPNGNLGSSSAISDLASMTGQCSRKSQIDSLPFYELESCTASRQEHIISVNLRELNMHLLKQSTENRISKFQWQSQAPMHVHAVTTRYVAAQLEQSRFLCHILCKAVAYDSRLEHEKGFAFVDQLSENTRHVLFTVLEKYYLAVESIAYPLPQGFTSFFTFLGYRTLRFDIFLQYVQRSVFELHIDVMKMIMKDIDDTKEGIQKKLKLLSLLPRSRAKRLLCMWNHSVSLMIRAREHSFNILSGVEGTNSRLVRSERNKHQLGLTAFPSEDRLSPLDTFLDLLTAKASLTELDFGLLIEATVASIDEFL